MSKAAEWTSCTVKDVIERHFCGPSPDCEERQIFLPEEWGVLKTTAITWAGWNERAHKVLPKEFWGQTKIEVNAGDVLVTKAGPRNRVGVVCHVPSTRNQLVVSGKMIGLRLISGSVNASFLAGLLARQEQQKYIHDRTTGMAESQVNFANEVLLDTPLRIPPIQEQDTIAKVLDTLDIAIRETESIIDKVKSVKQGLLHDLLTRGIDDKGELRPLQSEAPKLYKESQLGWIPKEWHVEQLEDLLADADPAMRSGPFGSALLKDELVESGLPLLGIDNVHTERFASEFKRFVTPEKFLQLSRYSVRPADLMITIMGTVGRCCLVPDDIGQALSSKHTWTISLDQERYSPYLAMLQVNYSPWVAQHFTKDQQGGTMMAIRSETLRSLLLPVPARHEQYAIEARLREISKRIDAEKASLAKMKLEKMGLMNDLLTGRIRVTSLLGTSIP